MTKIAFLTNFVSPYRRPLLQRVADTPGWDLRVFVNSRTEFDRSWTVDTSGLDVVRSRSLSVKRRVRSPGRGSFEQSITLHVPLRLQRDLRAFQPDLVLSHELGPRSLVAADYARRNRVPLVLWSYQSLVSASQGAWRNWLRRRLLKRAKAVIGMGTQARAVLEGWGLSPERVVDAPNAADHETLATRLAAPGAESRRDELRARWPGKKLALVVGRLVPLKGTQELLRQWDRLPGDVRRGWQLVFLGDGPLASEVQAHASAAHVSGVAPAEVADWLAAADLHVFPSMGDVWGLVVNEAMHCGAPTLCSSLAGCADDLILPGVTGLRFDPRDTSAEGLRRALVHPDLPALAEQARAHVREYSQDRMAAGFRTAIRAALK